MLDTAIARAIDLWMPDVVPQRGTAETVSAAIWYSDLRDFTQLNEHLPPAAVIALLDSYFDLVAGAIAARGGTVLQFIGDAILAIFRAPDGGDTSAVGAAALDAAIAAFDGLVAVNRRRRAAGDLPIRFGVGLHVGDVTHVTAGARNRLGFNVVGSAINRTARLESLTKKVGVPLLLSRELAVQLDWPLRACGRHRMKGVAEPRDVFTLVERMA